MSSQLSLAQLAHSSRFKRKSPAYEYDSYADEYHALYGQNKPKSPIAITSAADEDAEFMADYDRLMHNRDEIKAEHANKDFEAISGYSLDRILQCMRHVRESLKTDPRDQGKVIYPIDLVLMVILLARICGCISAPSIARYYKDHYLELQQWLPDVPPPNRMISRSTINTVMRMFSEEEIQELLTLYFSSPAASVQELSQCDEQRERPDGLLDTCGLDGQEMRSSFVRGVASRKRKGAHGVTLFNCTTKTILRSHTVAKKNQETNALLQMLPNLSVHGKVIMADALNSGVKVSTAIIAHGAHFLLGMKANAGNSELSDHIGAIFAREAAKPEGMREWLVAEFTEKGHGRIERGVIELLPSSKLDPRIKNPHPEVKSIVRYTKYCTYLNNGEVVKETASERYFICSLEFSEQTLLQVKYSILDYWGIETHHGILDDPRVFNQDAVQGCNPNFLSNTLGINKIALNVLTSVRHFEAKRHSSNNLMSFAETQQFLSQRSVAFQLWHLVRCFNSDLLSSEGET